MRVRKARSLSLERSFGYRSGVQSMFNTQALDQRTLRVFLSVIFTLLILGMLALSCGKASAATLIVPAGGDLQGAINAAQPGDTVVLQAGATYVGPITLPLKSGSTYITVQSSALDSLPSGQRVTPGASGLMPKIVSPGLGDQALRTVP